MFDEPATHEQIAAALGISRTRVQQIEAAALAKVRLAMGGDGTGPASLYLAAREGVPDPDDSAPGSEQVRYRRRHGVRSRGGARRV